MSGWSSSIPGFIVSIDSTGYLRVSFLGAMPVNLLTNDSLALRRTKFENEDLFKMEKELVKNMNHG